MATISKTVGVSAFILCIGLSYAYAAHPQAETHPSDDRGSQGKQEMIKGDSTPKKDPNDKVDDAKLKEDTKQAREEFDKRNGKGQEEMSPKVPSRILQNN
jgi:hypothetical protein